MAKNLKFDNSMCQQECGATRTVSILGMMQPVKITLEDDRHYLVMLNVPVPYDPQILLPVS